MANAFRNLNNSQLTELIGATISVIEPIATTYGVTDTQCDAITTLATALNNAVTDAVLANQAKLAAFEAQSIARIMLLDAIGDFTKRIYADPTVTNQELKAAGLAERTTPTPREPAVPTDLVVYANADGTISAKWKRNGGPANTVFVVQARSAGGTWAPMGSFTSTRATLSGFPPGVEKFIRVIATRNNQSSMPSNVEVIYPSEETLSLQLAA